MSEVQRDEGQRRQLAAHPLRRLGRLRSEEVEQKRVETLGLLEAAQVRGARHAFAGRTG
jgi:hypothetical protein